MHKWLAVVSQHPRKASWRRWRAWRRRGWRRAGWAEGVACAEPCVPGFLGLSTGRGGTGTGPLSAAPSPAGAVGGARPAPGDLDSAPGASAAWRGGPWRATVVFSLLPVFKARGCVPFCPVGLGWAEGLAVEQAAGPRSCGQRGPGSAARRVSVSPVRGVGPREAQAYTHWSPSYRRSRLDRGKPRPRLRLLAPVPCFSLS